MHQFKYAAFFTMFMILACVVTATAQEQANDYEIKLVRPAAVGDKYEMHVVVSDEGTNTVSIDDVAQPAETQNIQVTLDATAEVLAVENGNTKSMRLTIDRLSRREEDQTRELLPGGAVVTATQAGKETTFSLQNGRLSSEVEKSLDLVVPLSETDDQLEAQAFGTKERKKVGETWSFDPEAATRFFNAVDIRLNRRSIKGEGKLVSIKTVNGVECMEISISFGATGMPNNLITTLPQGLTVRKSDIKYDITIVVPVEQDGKMMVQSGAILIEIELAGRAPNGATMKSSGIQKRSIEAEIKPLG